MRIAGTPVARSAHVPDRGGHRDVGVADSAAEPVVARARRAVGLEHAERGEDLAAAPLHPQLRDLAMEAQFVEQADRLLRHPGCQRGDPHRLPARRLVHRVEPSLGRHEAVDVVHDGVAVDQRLAVVEHQDRHTRQGVVGADTVGIAEHRPRPVLERQAIERQRNADAAHEG